MSKTMRRQIQAKASVAASRGKLPPVVGVACARPGGFPTAAAFPSDATEAREAHAEGGIPEGGSSLKLPDKGSSPPCLFPAEQVFAFTDSQRAALSFAALCEAESLKEGEEAHHPEVREAIRHLLEARAILEEGRQL